MGERGKTMGKNAESINFYMLMSSGQKFEISETDYNNLVGRIARGSTAGWYAQRGRGFDDMHGWRFQLKDIAGIWKTGEDVLPEMGNLDIEKRLPPEVGKAVEETPESTCGLHDWNDPTTWTYVTQIVSGINRYYKQCEKCQGKSQLVKKREVELYMKDAGLTIDDVPLVD